MTFSVRQLLIGVSIMALVLVVYSCRAREDAKNRALFSSNNEVIQLGQAIHGYKDFVGDFPPPSSPDELRSHLSAQYDGLSFSDLFATNRDIEKIGDSELVYLWLYEIPVLTKVNVHPEASYFYEFDTDRLSDRDNDGWLEYYSECDTVFRYVNETIEAINPVTGKLFGSKP